MLQTVVPRGENAVALLPERVEFGFALVLPLVVFLQQINRALRQAHDTHRAVGFRVVNEHAALR